MSSNFNPQFSKLGEILIKNGDVKVNNLIYKEFSIDSKIVKDISVRGQKLSKNKKLSNKNPIK